MAGVGIGAIVGGKEVTIAESAYVNALADSTTSPKNTSSSVVGAMGKILVGEVLPPGDARGRASASGFFGGGIAGLAKGGASASPVWATAGAVYPWALDSLSQSIKRANRKRCKKCD
jgi:hypothetical protein